MLFSSKVAGLSSAEDHKSRVRYVHALQCTADAMYCNCNAQAACAAALRNLVGVCADASTDNAWGASIPV